MHDLGDAVVMPGLVDAHLHLRGMDDGIPAARDWSPFYRILYAAQDLKKLLDAGVTSARCMGSPLSPHLAKSVSDGITEGPRLLAAGEYICQRGGTWDLVHQTLDEVNRYGIFADGVDECRRRVRERIRSGSGVIKIGASSGHACHTEVHTWGDDPSDVRRNYSAEEISVMTEEAHRAGLKVSAHAIGDEAIRHAIDHGVDIIEHGHGATPQTLDAIAEREVVVVPTLTLPYVRAVSGHEHGLPQHKIDTWRMHHELQMASVGEMKRRGIRVGAGSDLIGPPTTPMGINATEFKLLYQAGLSAYETLRASTNIGSELMGLSHSIGRISPGYLADVIAVPGSPFENLDVLRTPDFVMKDGVVHKQ
ncbi:MAG TPA: amidohydrolase family protein [Egicoccus sp.]|nr:amidohydrolase family protein [Egicoccus sp.]HSK24612.1 amidohydrolase family protein [Egicoccus sp.]